MRSIEKIDGKYYMPVTEAWYKDFKALTDYEADRKGIASGKKFTVVYIENETRLHVADVSESKDYSYAEIDKHVVYGENFPTELAQKMSILQMVSDQELSAGQVGTGFKINPHLFYYITRQAQPIVIGLLRYVGVTNITMGLSTYYRVYFILKRIA